VLKRGGNCCGHLKRAFSLTRNPWHVREYEANGLKSLMGRYFPVVDTRGIHGNDKVMTYYEQNRNL
jgi:hypothetical protein